MSKIQITSLLLFLLFSGCNENYDEQYEYYTQLNNETTNTTSKIIKKKSYCCDEWDAIVYFTDGTTTVIERVSSPARTCRNGTVYIYDKRHSFDARFMSHKNNIKHILFVKPQ